MARNSIMPVGSDPFGIFDPSGWDRSLAPVRSVAKPAFASVKCDVKETDEGFEITADFPGADKDDINLSLDEGVLTISYEKSEEKDEGDDEKGYIVKERSSVSMKRSLMLGDVDEESAKATLENGVLTLTIDKKEPVETKKTIEIG